MTTQEALDRALEALREIRTCERRHPELYQDELIGEMRDRARETLNEIQRGLWIESVSPTPREAVKRVVRDVEAYLR